MVCLGLVLRGAQPGGPVCALALEEARDGGWPSAAEPSHTEGGRFCVHHAVCFLYPAAHTEPPAGVLAGAQVVAMPTLNFRSACVFKYAGACKLYGLRPDRF
jgi:hypothetical protein